MGDLALRYTRDRWAQRDDPVRRRVRLGALYDLYGPLLTSRQRHLVELSAYDDLSLAEIAGELGVTRQAVHDTLARAASALEAYEARLGLLAGEERRASLLRELASLLDAVAAGRVARLQAVRKARRLVRLLAPGRGVPGLAAGPGPSGTSEEEAR